MMSLLQKRGTIEKMSKQKKLSPSEEHPPEEYWKAEAYSKVVQSRKLHWRAKRWMKPTMYSPEAVSRALPADSKKVTQMERDASPASESLLQTHWKRECPPETTAAPRQ